MGNIFYFDWEVSLMEWLQSLMGDAMVSIASFITIFGEELILVALLGFVYWCYDKEFGRFIGLNIAIGLVLNPMIKNIALRRRPYMDNPGIKCLRPVIKGADINDITVQGFSFPSAHAMNSAIIYGAFPVYKRKKICTVFGIIIPFLVGISRVMLGVHYPTDVLTGWCIGVGTLFLFSFLQNKIKNKYKLYIIITVISFLGIFYVRTNDYYTGLGIMTGLFAAEWFEKKFVNFENTKVVPEIIIRILGGIVLYFIINTLLKLPFPKHILEAENMLAFIIRTVRYFIIVFLILGVYPLAFKNMKIRSKH